MGKWMVPGQPGVSYRVGKRCHHVGPPHPQLDCLLPGDVLRTPKGLLRKVRSVSYCACGDRVWAVTFAKVHRSRYNRPYTVYWRREIEGWQLVATGVSLCSTRLECAVQQAVELMPPVGMYITQDETVGLVT